MATLVGHAEPVQELAVNDERQHLFSLSADKVIKVWDIKTYLCLQTMEVKLRFRPVNMITAMGFDEVRKVLLLGTRKLNVARSKASNEAETSHDSPISCVLFNSTFEIVASCDENSTICVWDIETGARIFRFSLPQSDGGKITAACFDEKQRRLITAFHSGAITIWNFSNGQCLTEMASPDGKEVTCVLIIKPKYAGTQNVSIVSGGWSKRVHVWPDTKEEEVTFARAIPEQQSDRAHKADITSMVYSAFNGMLITGASDGTTIGWIYETGYPKHMFHECDPTCIPTKLPSIEKSVEFVSPALSHETS